MKNGSRSEYYLVEGGLKMTRVRQSEWRRRWGVQGIVTLDLQVGASADDTSIWVGANWSNSLASWWSPGVQAIPTDIRSGSFRFTNVTIPAGATITTAYVQIFMIATGNDGVGTKTKFWCEDVDDSVAPTSYADFTGKTMTTAGTDWDDNDFAEGWEISPSIVGAVQEVIDRGGWASGQALSVFWKDDGSTTDFYHKQEVYDDDSTHAMKLHVEYTA